MSAIVSRILSLAAAFEATPQQDRRLEYLMSGLTDTALLIDTAVREGMAGLLYRHLKRSGCLEALDTGQARRLQSVYQATARLKRSWAAGYSLSFSRDSPAWKAAGPTRSESGDSFRSCSYFGAALRKASWS